MIWESKRSKNLKSRLTTGVSKNIPASARNALQEFAIHSRNAWDDTFRVLDDEGVGCIECGGTGYKGRMAICELLDLSDHIRELILEKRPTSEIKKAAREEGMTFLRESAIQKANEIDDRPVVKRIPAMFFICIRGFWNVRRSFAPIWAAAV